MSHFVQDLRFAFRRLRKSPGFALVAVVVLALGTGATTTVFSVVHGVLLKPLPLAESHRLYRLAEIETETGREASVSFANFVDWCDSVESFDGLAALRFDSLNLTGAREPEQLRTARVSPEFFRVFAAAPRLGRAFTAEENDASSEAVIVLGDGLWQRQLGGREDVVGETLQLDGEAYTVVGVMPPEFDFPEWADFWMPLGDLTEWPRDRRELQVFGRRGAGVDDAAAQLEMDVVARRMAEAYPETQKGHGVVMRSLLEDRVGSVRNTVLTLFGAVGGVLLIVCLNIAALQVVRGLERRRELAVRAALGAGRRRVLRQLITESLLLALVGGAFGVLLAYWGLDLIVALAPRDIPRLAEVTVAPPVLGFALLATVATGVLFGLLPALQALRFDVNSALKAGQNQTPSPWRPSLRGALVVAQIALTVVLLAGAGLLGKSFLRLTEVDPGFDVDSLLRLGLVMPPDAYPEPDQRVRFLAEAAARLGALPEIESAAAGNYLPLGSPGHQVAYAPTRAAGGEAPAEREAFERVVTVGYFETLGIPLVAGRTFTSADDDRAGAAAIVNENLARRSWPGRSPVGETIRLPLRDGDDVLATVVGVVGDLHHQGPGTPPHPEIFRPHAQNPWSYMNLVARVRQGPPERLLRAAQEAVWEVDPQRTLFNVGSTRQSLGYHLERPRFSALLLALFSIFALVLAAVGIYSVMAFTVSQRSREIGIRMTLGARRGAVHRMMAGHGMTLTAIGLALGIGGALAATRLLESLLFEISATDVSTFAAVSIVLAGVAYLAVHVPAVRASRVDPMAILRDE